MSCLMMINTSRQIHVAGLLQPKKRCGEKPRQIRPSLPGWQNSLQGSKSPSRASTKHCYIQSVQHDLGLSAMGEYSINQ